MMVSSKVHCAELKSLVLRLSLLSAISTPADDLTTAVGQFDVQQHNKYCPSIVTVLGL